MTDRVAMVSGGGPVGSSLEAVSSGATGAYLTGEDAGFITGQTLSVSGGPIMACRPEHH